MFGKKTGSGTPKPAAKNKPAKLSVEDTTQKNALGSHKPKKSCY